MKYGLCAGLDKIAEVAALGFDYLEPPVNGTAALSEEDFEAKLAMVKGASIPCPAFNLLFPKTMQVLVPETTDDMIAEYLHTAMKRVQLLGGRVAVFGSGKSRNCPEGMTYGEAFRRLVEVTRLTGEIAQQYGVVIVIEPLNRTETNMINSMAEGAALVAMVNHPNVQLLCDSFHVAKENEPFTDVVRLGGVSHVHVATKEGRRYPLEKDADLTALYEALKATNYDGMISIEGKTDDMAQDAPVSIALLKNLWEEM